MPFLIITQLCNMYFLLCFFKYIKSLIKNNNNYKAEMFLLLLSTRLVFLVSGGPGRPPLSGHSVAVSLRNKLHKQKSDFLIYKARWVDTVGK